MLKLFHVLGIATDEISSFCHLFSSLTDMRDEFIHYLPNTLTYNDVPGNAVDEDAQDKDENGNSGEGDNGDSDDGDDTTQLVVEHIHRFAQEMRGGGRDVVVVEDKDIACDPNDTTS
eukprot:4293859-Ditylum_brightwellii.AAC.1